MTSDFLKKLRGGQAVAMNIGFNFRDMQSPDTFFLRPSAWIFLLTGATRVDRRSRGEGGPSMLKLTFFGQAPELIGAGIAAATPRISRFGSLAWTLALVLYVWIVLQERGRCISGRLDSINSLCGTFSGQRICAHEAPLPSRNL